MFNTEPTVLSERIRKRIDRLHADKVRNNIEKNSVYGLPNTDDWGYIYHPGFVFTPPPSDREDGLIRGYVMIGKTLRKFFEEIPRYVNPASALAGAWVQTIAQFAKIGVAPEDIPSELVPVWAEYNTYPGFCAMNHCGPAMEIGLKLGWGGLLKKLRYYRAFNAPADTSFYDGEEDVVLGMQNFVAGLAEKARTMAAETDDACDRENLLKIAEMNEYLVEGAPRNLREACQFIAHFQSLDRTYFAGGALDQIDELLRPYYEAGGDADEDVVWYLASLFFNDTHYSQIAGPTPDGSRDKTSRMSFLVLDAMHALRIPVNIALRVHDNVNEALLRRALEYTVADSTGVSYSLDHGITNGYARNGYPAALGRMRTKVGCNWVAIPGIEYPLQDVTRCNFAFAFTHALENIRTGERSLDALWSCFAHHLKIIVDSIKSGYDYHYERVSRNTPEMVLNLFMYGPVERGLNCAEGGVDILNLNIDGIALATVADSFAAIELRVVQQKKIDWDTLFVLLDTDYAGREDLRLMLKNIPRFGAPDSPAEKWAVRIRDLFVRLCKETGTPRHNLPIIPGLFSHGEIYTYAKDLSATPNGRRRGDPISHSNEPDPGFARGIDTFALSLKASAVARLQPGYGNSAPLHLDIETELLRAAGGVDALIALLHAHDKMGGTLINLNCLKLSDLMEAHADPSTHPDLVVRVTGYSAFFASLSKEYRQQIIDRFLSGGSN